MHPRPIVITLAAAALAGAASAPAAEATTVTPADATQATPGCTRLSNETTLSRWANTNEIVKVKAQPKGSARVVGKLRWNTEDGPAEVYLLLQECINAQGADWVQLRLPKRPNGTTGWVPRDAVSPQFTVVRTQLVINRRKHRITLFKRGHKIFSAPVGVGRPSLPTPAGHFWIREKLKGIAGNPVYGPWAFGTAAYSAKLTDWPGGGVIGIHGTNEPRLIPGNPSHGCVRLKNPAIRKLARLLPIGTPLRIL